VPSAKFLLEKDNVVFTSKIHIEGYDAARSGDRIEANHINTALIEPNPYSAHKAAEGIALSAFNACAKCGRSAHVALLIAGLGGSALISQSATCLVLECCRSS
jgi:hypothetical protein